MRNTRICHVIKTKPFDEKLSLEANAPEENINQALEDFQDTKECTFAGTRLCNGTSSTELIEAFAFVKESVDLIFFAAIQCTNSIEIDSNKHFCCIQQNQRSLGVLKNIILRIERACHLFE